MLVCDVSAIDRLIDMYGENLSVNYKNKNFDLYDLRDEFVDNNVECSLNNYKHLLKVLLMQKVMYLFHLIRIN